MSPEELALAEALEQIRTRQTATGRTQAHWDTLQGGSHPPSGMHPVSDYLNREGWNPAGTFLELPFNFAPGSGEGWFQGNQPAWGQDGTDYYPSAAENWAEGGMLPRAEAIMQWLARGGDAATMAGLGTVLASGGLAAKPGGAVAVGGQGVKGASTAAQKVLRQVRARRGGRVSGDAMPTSNRIPEGLQDIGLSAELRHMSPEDARDLSMLGVHLRRVGENTQYVGAPRGVDSSRKLNRMRRNFDEQVAKGPEAGDWYDRTQEGTRQITGGDPLMGDRFSNEAALWSAQSDPDSNLGFVLQGHNSYEAGVPRDVVRTGHQMRRYTEAMDRGELPSLGPKTGVYYQYINPNLGMGSTGVNDFRHARNFGYTQLSGDEIGPISRGLSPPEHRFLDAETILATERANQAQLGGRSDWRADQVQAAPWVVQKAESLMARYPKRFPDFDSAMAEANKTYPDHFAKYSAYNTHEAIPMAGSGQHPSLIEAPLEVRQRFTRDPGNDWNTPGTDRDGLMQDAGLYHLSTREGLGSYLNPQGVLETNPVRVTPALVGRQPDSLQPVPGGGEGPSRLVPGRHAVDEPSSGMMDAVAAHRSYWDVQGASPWHHDVAQGPVGEMNSLRFNLGRDLTPEDMNRLQPIADSYGMGVLDRTGGNVALGNFGDTIPDGQAMRRELTRPGGLGSQLEEAVGPGLNPERMRLNTVANRPGSYPSFEDVWPVENFGAGAATRRYIDLMDNAAADAPRTVERLGRSENTAGYLGRKSAADTDWAHQLDGPAPRADIENARRIYSDAVRAGQNGIEALRAALGRGEILPAAAAALLGGGLMLHQDDEAASPPPGDS